MLLLEGEKRAALRLLQADNLLSSSCIQTLVKHFPLVGQILALPLIVAGVGVGLQWGVASLHLLLLLLGGQLLVGGGTQAPLAQGQEHLWRCGHRHDYSVVSGPQASIDLLYIAQGLASLVHWDGLGSRTVTRRRSTLLHLLYLTGLGTLSRARILRH